MTRRIEGVPAIEVYISDKGYVCLKQENPFGDESDVVVMLPVHVPLIVKWLQEAATQVENEPVGIIETNED
jgi:hypothetical protein